MSEAKAILYQINKLKLLFLKYFTKKPTAKNPTINATTEPSRRLNPNSPAKLSLTSNNFLKPLPKSIGKESRKLNLTASLLFKPRISPPEIVAPDLETPGISASI